MKIILGIGMVVTENRLRKMGFVEKEVLYDTKPKQIWVIGNHMTDSGSFADTIMFDPDKNRISVSYGGNISIPVYQQVESTWDVKQFLKEHPHDDEKTLHEEKYGTDEEEWKIILLTAGQHRFAVMREIKEILGLSLVQAKEIVNDLPQKISTELFEDKAYEIKAKLEKIGAVVEIR